MFEKTVCVVGQGRGLVESRDTTSCYVECIKNTYL